MPRRNSKLRLIPSRHRIIGSTCWYLQFKLRGVVASVTHLARSCNHAVFVDVASRTSVRWGCTLPASQVGAGVVSPVDRLLAEGTVRTVPVVVLGILVEHDFFPRRDVLNVSNFLFNVLASRLLGPFCLRVATALRWGKSLVLSDELVTAAGEAAVLPTSLCSSTAKTLDDPDPKPSSAPTREPTYVASLSSLMPSCRYAVKVFKPPTPRLTASLPSLQPVGVCRPRCLHLFWGPSHRRPESHMPSL